VQKYVVIGTGGHANSILDLIQSCGGAVEYFVGSQNEMTQHRGIPTVDFFEISSSSPKLKFVFGIGDYKIRNRVLKEMNLSKHVIKFPPLIHPTAYVSKSATIANGTVVFANSYVGPNSRIGKFCILNTGASVEHDCMIGNQNFLAPGSILAGKVKIGDNCFLGMGSLISDGISIGSDSVIAANSFVNGNIPSNSFAAGTPAKLR
jgi:sugar O-acyltransferase (sialic acid O-acetyltransferase NeuD family)